MMMIEPEPLDYKAEDKWFEDRDLELVGIKYINNESYLCYPGGFRKSTMLLIMKRKQMKLILSS